MFHEKRKQYYTLRTVPDSWLKDKLDKNLPKYTCKTCAKCQNSYCTFFNRHILPDNRCFNHSNYHTVAVRYQEPEQLKELKEEYERRKLG